MEPMYLYYLIGINVLAFFAFGLDKQKAIKNKYRIPERNLFTLAITGGSIGAFLGMFFFHHKTRKWYFRIGIPAILVIQVITICIISYI